GALPGEPCPQRAGPAQARRRPLPPRRGGHPRRAGLPPRRGRAADEPGGEARPPLRRDKAGAYLVLRPPEGHPRACTGRAGTGPRPPEPVTRFLYRTAISRLFFWAFFPGMNHGRTQTLKTGTTT